jgi:hypothetical protein
MQAKEETVKKYRQWLGALLECTTKLSAGRAAAAAADAEVKQREADLSLLNEEVAAFMSKARWVAWLCMLRSDGSGCGRAGLLEQGQVGGSPAMRPLYYGLQL